MRVTCLLESAERQKINELFSSFESHSSPLVSAERDLQGSDVSHWFFARDISFSHDNII